MGLIPRSAEAIARANTIINERNAKREGSMRVDARGAPVNSFGRRLEFSAGGVAVVSSGDDGGGAPTRAFESAHGGHSEHIKWPDLASESETGSREASERDLSGYRRTTTTTSGRDQRASSTTTTRRIRNARDGRSKQKKNTHGARKPLETTIEYVPSEDEDEYAFQRLPSRGAGNVISVYDDDSDDSSSDEDNYKNMKTKPTKVVVVGRRMQPMKSSLKVKGTVHGQAATESARNRSVHKHDEFSQPPREGECAVCCVIA